jgi:hypothetical protein
MNKAKHKNDLPGNRLSGIPSNARFAGAGIMVGLAFTVINLTANLSVYTNEAQAYFTAGAIVFFPTIFVGVLLAWLLNTGKLIFIKLSRKVALFVTTAYAGVILLDFAQALYYGIDRSLIAISAGVVLTLISPILFLMWRDFRRCRWLDPNSLPSEWETAAIRDPNSINYRPERLKRQK